MICVKQEFIALLLRNAIYIYVKCTMNDGLSGFIITLVTHLS